MPLEIKTFNITSHEVREAVQSLFLFLNFPCLPPQILPHALFNAY